MKTIALNPDNLEVYISPSKELVSLVKSKKKRDLEVVSKMNPLIVSAIRHGKKIPLATDKLKITMMIKE
jgi:hypothetical protein